MKTKLTSRKFWVAVLGAILTVVSEGLGQEVPWEAVGILVAYILGEGASDVVGTFKRGGRRE